MGTGKCYHAGSGPQLRILRFTKGTSRRLAPCNRSKDYERLFPAGDRLRQRSVRRIVSQILFARKEAQERAALQRAVVADGAAQHGIAGFECVENCALCHWGYYFELRVAGKMGQRSQVGW